MIRALLRDWIVFGQMLMVYLFILLENPIIVWLVAELVIF
jgi:hypothetical protein